MMVEVITLTTIKIKFKRTIKKREKAHKNHYHNNNTAINIQISHYIDSREIFKNKNVYHQGTGYKVLYLMSLNLLISV